MSDYDEGYVIIERRTGNFGTFVWGMLMGAAAALLFAPKSGLETRRELSDSMTRMRGEAENRVREVQGSVNDARRQFEEGVRTARRAASQFSAPHRPEEHEGDEANEA